jgi:hypothetical protein
MKRTAQAIEEKNAEKGSVETPKAKRRMHPNSLANLVAPWTPESHPKGGRPRDTAGDISRAVFENNKEAIYKAVAAKLLAGDAYAFSVHSDRAYGKLKQTNVHVGDEDGGPISANLTVTFVKPPDYR